MCAPGRCEAPWVVCVRSASASTPNAFSLYYIYPGNLHGALHQMGGFPGSSPPESGKWGQRVLQLAQNPGGTEIIYVYVRCKKLGRVKFCTRGAPFTRHPRPPSAHGHSSPPPGRGEGGCRHGAGGVRPPLTLPGETPPPSLLLLSSPLPLPPSPACPALPLSALLAGPLLPPRLPCCPATPAPLLSLLAPGRGMSTHPDPPALSGCRDPPTRPPRPGPGCVYLVAERPFRIGGIRYPPGYPDVRGWRGIVTIRSRHVRAYLTGVGTLDRVGIATPHNTDTEGRTR